MREKGSYNMCDQRMSDHTAHVHSLIKVFFALVQDLRVLQNIQKN